MNADTNPDNPPPLDPAPQSTPPPEPPPEPISDEPGLRELFESLLRRPAELADHPTIGRGPTVTRLLGLGLASMLVFGFVLGSFAYGHQLWAAPLKLVFGVLFAGLICFPSLYIFASLAGSRASLPHLACGLAGMLALAGLLLVGFAPALWIFAQGTNSFGFFGALGLLAWAVALFFGFRFLRTALAASGARQKAPLTVWCVVFALVSLQLTTSLRPLIGRSDHFLTSEKKFFLQHWVESLGRSLDQPNAAP